MKKEKKSKQKKVGFTKSIKLKLIVLSVLSVFLAFLPMGVYLINTYGTDIDSFITNVDENLLICAGASVVILLMMGFLISGSVAGSLRTLTRVADKAARLDFSENKDKDKLAGKNDEIAFVNKAISELHGRITDISDNVRKQRKNVSESRKQLLQTFSELAEGIEGVREAVGILLQENSQQLQHASCLRASLDSISNTMAAEKKDIGSLKESLETLSELAAKSEAALTEVIKINEKTVVAIGTVTEQTGGRYKSENAINDIVAELLRNIEEITLLSLNASSEAARAGACGRDFGLVAMQIRNVSEEATGKVNDIEEIISEFMYHSQDRLAKLQSLGAASQLLTDRLDKAGGIAGDLKNEMDTVPARILNLSEGTEGVEKHEKNAVDTLEQLKIVVNHSKQLEETINERIDMVTEDIETGRGGTEVLESWCKELDRQTEQLGE